MTTRPWTAANSAALRAILPRVAKQCGMPFTPSLVYKRKVNPLAARDMRHPIGNNTHTLLNSPTTSELVSITPPGTWRTRLLSRLACSCPTTGTPVQSNTVPRAHHCWTYGPGRNQDKSRVSCFLASTIEG
jgi:hypothetical protein